MRSCFRFQTNKMTFEKSYDLTFKSCHILMYASQIMRTHWINFNGVSNVTYILYQFL